MPGRRGRHASVAPDSAEDRERVDVRPSPARVARRLAAPSGPQDARAPPTLTARADSKQTEPLQEAPQEVPEPGRAHPESISTFPQLQQAAQFLVENT